MATNALKARAVAVAAICAGGALAPLPVNAVSGLGPTETMARTWGVSGRVSALTNSSVGVVAAGDLSMAMAPSGARSEATSLVVLHPETGVIDALPVHVDGEIRAVAVDGTTAYLGGDFRHVNGLTRVSLASVSLVDGSVQPWAPSANVDVEALAVEGPFVYAGGGFTTITDSDGTVSVPHLARLSKSSGALDVTWSSGITLTDRVRSLLVKPGSAHLYVGGDWTALDGHPGSGKIFLVSTGATPVVDATYRTGPINDGQPSPVFSMSIEGNSLLIAAGGRGGGCTLQNATTGATQWSYHTNGNVVAAVLRDGRAFCGGHFNGSGSFGSYSRHKLAQVDASTGTVLDWAPVVNSALGVFTLASAPTALVVGGDFTKVGSTVQPHLGMFVMGDAIRAPSMPLNALAAPGDSAVQLTWDAPDYDGGAKLREYEVFRSRGAGAFSVVGTTKAQSYADSTVVNGTSGDPGSAYHYYVVAKNSVGRGTSTATMTVTPLASLVMPPAAPEDFTAVGQFGQNHLEWSAPETDGGGPITGYVIHRGTVSGALEFYATTGASVTDLTDTAVTSGTQYYYKVYAKNSVGSGPASIEEWATPTSGAPGAPTLTGNHSGGPVHLTWAPSGSGASSITQYVLLRDGVRIYKGPASQLSYNDSAAPSGHVVEYKVKAVNAYGASKFSNVVAFTLL